MADMTQWQQRMADEAAAAKAEADRIAAENAAKVQTTVSQPQSTQQTTQQAGQQVTLTNPATGGVENYTLTDNPNIGIDAGGNRVYIGGYVPGGYTPQNTQAIQAAKVIQPNQVSVVNPATGATEVYTKTDNPNIGIDAGGNRVYIGGYQPGGQVAQQAAQASQPVTDTKLAQQIATNMQKEGLGSGVIIQPGETGEQITAKLQAQAIQAAQVQAGITPSVFAPNTATTTIPQQAGAEYIKLDSGQVIPKAAIVQMAPQDQAKILESAGKESYVLLGDGQLALKSEFASKTPEQQQTLLTQGFSAYKETFKTTAQVTADVRPGIISEILYDSQGKPLSQTQSSSLLDVQNKIAEIKQRQADFAAKPITEQAKDILNTKVTGEGFLQKTLSLGGTKIAAFDKDQIALDYLTARETALKSGGDLSIDQQSYEDMVLGKQQTAAELGMQFVPFEYFRPERITQIQAWEAVVYPMLDVATFIPIVGLGAKGLSAGLKGSSLAAKIVAMGGKDAIEFAAKDAAVQLAKAEAKTAAQRELVTLVEQGAKEATESTTKQVLTNALKPALKDVALAEKELSQITKNVDELGKLAELSKTVDTTQASAKALESARAFERSAGGVAKTAIPATNIVQAGVIGRTTVANWDDLNPVQRAAGITLAVLPLGIHGKIINTLENVLDPYKIPQKALVARATGKLPSTPEGWAKTHLEGGKIYAEASGGTTRLIIDEGIGTPKEARAAVASLQKQIIGGAEKATAEYGTKEVVKYGTGFQTVVGKTVVSATPMGEIFKEGTGAFGKKTNLERFLAQSGTDIELKGKPISYTNPLTGAVESVEAKAVAKSGVTVMGKEGGLYTGTELFPKFTEQAAFGGKGGLKAGILIGTPEVSKLPLSAARLQMPEMRDTMIKSLNEGKMPNEILEGFKQYKQFMELENVVSGETQLDRVQNIRSRLADKLGLDQGEYYTRTPQGKTELFQMYMEGGRTTPYTLSELYQLKGKALRNSLEDMFFGLTDTIDNLKSGKLSKADSAVVKEEQIASRFADIDNEFRAGRFNEREVARMKTEVLDEFRRASSPTIPRAELRRQIIQAAVRAESMPGRDKERTGQIEQVRAESNRPMQENRQERVSTRQEPSPRPEVRRMEATEGERVIRAEEARTERLERKGLVIPREEIRITSPRETVRTTPREDVRQPARETTERPIVERTPIVERVPTTERLTVIPRERMAMIEKPIPTLPIIINTKEGKREITQKQLDGAIAWKQGIMYITWLDPHQQKDLIYTRKPIAGVKYFEGPGSAAKSIVSLYGEVPEFLHADMGVVDINIKGQGTAQPILTFKEDKYAAHKTKRSRKSNKSSITGIWSTPSGRLYQ
jgi:hypothetical protein